jgi:thioredoxin 1
MGNALEFNEENFDSEVLKSDIPVLVDFTASWCGPCQVLAPVIEQLATEHAGSVKVGKVDADQSQQLLATYGIMSVPTVVLFKGGEPVESILGAQPKKTYEAKLEALKG